MKPIYSIVVPVYNEEEVIRVSYQRLTEVMKSLGEPYELIFVNDGSRDKTPEILKEICGGDKSCCFINFSRNFGHQPAITAGMDYARGDAIVVIDADLQDPPSVILDMIDEWKNGYEVVYGKRAKRLGETGFKKLSAKIYYRLLGSMTNVEIPVDTGDFRLIDRKVCETLKQMPEKTRYVRGLVAWVGYKQKAVEYVREERFAGETKYPLSKMLKLAMDGIAAFSVKPLKLATVLGTVLSIFGSFEMLITLIMVFLPDRSFDGYSMMMYFIMTVQGITLLILGLIGEYIGRIFEQAKGRPVYIVSETIGFDEKPL